MTTYRTGNHWGVTIVAEPTPEAGSNLEQAGSSLVAVVVNGDQALAERICALLNGDEQPPAAGDDITATPYRIYSRWRKTGNRSNVAVYAAIQEAYALGLASGAPPHTPDVDHTRGAAEALAAIRRRLTYDGVLYPGDALLLQEVAAELGVDGDAPTAALDDSDGFCDRTGPHTHGAASDGDAPSRPLSASVSAQEAPAGGSGPQGGSEALSAGRLRAVGLCPQRAEHHLMESCGDCPYTQLAGVTARRASLTLDPAYRVARCGQSSAHGPHVVDHGPDQPRNCPGTFLRCICNDPPPTVDKPKNGTPSRPPGWACPRHGTVI